MSLKLLMLNRICPPQLGLGCTIVQFSRLSLSLSRPLSLLSECKTSSASITVNSALLSTFLIRSLQDIFFYILHLEDYVFQRDLPHMQVHVSGKMSFAAHKDLPSPPPPPLLHILLIKQASLVCEKVVLLHTSSSSS